MNFWKNYSFIIMVKGRKHLVSSIIDEHRNTFETDRSCRIRAYIVYGKTIKGRLYEDDTCDRYFHLYFNASRQSAEREQLEQMLDKQHLALEKSICKEVDLSKNCYDYFELICDKKNCLVSFKEKTDVIQQQLQRCGYFCIVTSEEMTASQALIHYKGRDISEKLFRADKSFLGSKSMRVQSAESLSSKVFIEFVALIVRNRIYNLLKENTLQMESRPNYMTVPAAIRELEKIEMVKRNDGSYRLDHAISKRQKTILASFGMNVTSIKDISNDISALLAKNQSLLASSNSNDEIDEELKRLEKELVMKAKNKDAYDQIADEILRLKEKRHEITMDTAMRNEKIERINNLQEFIREQNTGLTEYDESLVKRWLSEITVFDDRFSVELKSRIKVEIEG